MQGDSNTKIHYFVASSPGETSVSASLLWPTLFLFEEKLLQEDPGDSPLTRDIKQRIVTYLFRKYNGDAECKQVVLIATFLDPRFKNQYSDNKADVLTQMSKVVQPEQTTEITDNTDMVMADGAPQKAKIVGFFHRNRM